MRIVSLCLVTLLAAAPPADAQAPFRRDAALEAELTRLASEVDGDVGIYVRHLKTGHGALIRADELFPTASMVKLPILAATFQRIHDGALAFDSVLVWGDSLRYGDDDGLVNNLKPGTPVPLNQLTLMMITTSDNAASLWLQALVGGGAAVNEWLHANGFDSTRVNSRTPGRRPNWEVYGWGQTTPREIAELLARIRDGRAVSRPASFQMYRHLTRIHWNGEALSAIPPWVQVASKQGSVDRSRSEVALVNAPSGDYLFSVITRNQRDTTYAPTNQGYTLIRRVSALLWRRFEPGLPWTPPDGTAAYTP
ncbi:MAG: serine hydrolase [Gemmatimonadales bacterium]|nr:serine hydrolase [Gemmatimonadales bacterium]